jgi:exosortase A-associated hydrolase 1
VSAEEIPIVFDCEGARLLGIIHRPGRPARRGVLIVVGGPQYRVGSHRQFVLLARALAEAGIPAMRFDYRGMGDSDGPYRGFEAIGADIAAAIDAFQAHAPGLHEVVLWGLCDAASAIMFYAHRDARVAGLVLLNPWVRTEAGEAKTYLKHYYRARLTDPEFWRKALSGKVSVRDAAGSLLSFARRALGRGGGAGGGREDAGKAPLPDRMAEGFARYEGPVLLVMSGNDLTAREFEEATKASARWRELLARPGVARFDLPEADHTFSRKEWREELMRRTVEWCTEIKRGGSASTAEISGRNGRLEETRQREGGTHRRVRAGRI